MNHTSLTVLYKNTTWHLKSLFLFILPSTVWSAWLHLKWIEALVCMLKWEDSDTSWCALVWLHTPLGLPWHPECVASGTRSLWWSQLPSPPQGALRNNRFWTPGLCRKGRCSWHLCLYIRTYLTLGSEVSLAASLSGFKGVTRVKYRHSREWRCGCYCVMCVIFYIQIYCTFLWGHAKISGLTGVMWFRCVKNLSLTVPASKCFISCAFVKSAVYLWSIGECCCQGYPAIPAQGTIDDDSVNLGQIQWGTLPGHAHITGVVLPTEAALYYRARKAASCWELIKLYLWSVCVCRGICSPPSKKLWSKVQF